MNAAILLVSSAWMAGQTPDVIIPVHHAHSASCGTNCGDGCHEGFGHRLRERIRGLFQRDCCDPCPQPRCHEPRCREHRCHERCHVSHCHNDCDSSWGHGQLWERIRGAFHRDCGCNTGCRTGCCRSGATPAAEPLKDQPRKMPTKNEPKKGQEARVITPPAQTVPAFQNAPAIAPTPAVAPRIIENDTRNPF